MSGVSFTFDLGPVSGASKTASSPQSEAAVGAQFHSVQQSLPATATQSMPLTDSAACDGSSCFVVHGDGPGVTTLSIGEEDGGASDFISLPVVDGAQFMEPPIESFAGIGDYQVTTLAIGEEDGGAASMAGTISSSGSLEIGASQAAPQIMTEAIPEFSDGIETAQVSETYGVMQPIYSPGETPPAVYGSALPTSKPEQAEVYVSEAVPPASPSVSFAETPNPQQKPMDVASAAPPVPEAKPTIVTNGMADNAQPSMMVVDAESDTQYVSVGDYESYIASTGNEAASSRSTTSSTSNVTVTLSEPTTETPVEASVASTPTASIETVPIGAAQAQSPEPAYVIQEAASVGEVKAAPEMTPASVTLPASTQSEPLATIGSPVLLDNTASVSDVSSSAEIAAPLPTEKPAEGSLDAPRLSDDDFKITTLALGEEDAGGG